MEEKNIQEWIDIAEEDLSTAEWCVQGKKFLWAMVMCQQAIEKILKAIYLKKNEEIPPKIHNLNRLTELVGISNDLSEDLKEFFEELLIFYFTSRYPDKSAVLKKVLNEDFAIKFLDKTKEVFIWLKSKL